MLKRGGAAKTEATWISFLTLTHPYTTQAHNRRIVGYTVGIGRPNSAARSTIVNYLVHPQYRSRVRLHSKGTVRGPTGRAIGRVRSLVAAGRAAPPTREPPLPPRRCGFTQTGVLR